MAFPATTARYILFLLNLTFLVSAIGLAVVAILIEITFWNHNEFIPQDWTSPPIIITIACGIIFLVSLFGCCGVIRESRCCLIVFSVLLFIVVLGEIAAGIYIFNTRDTVATNLQKDMNLRLPEYNTNKNMAHAWNFLQHDLKCCGVTNASDWKPYMTGDTLPSGCCIDLPVNEMCTMAKATKIGCYSQFAQFIQSKLIWLAGIATGVGIAQLLCSIASGFLARHINRQYEAV